MSTTEDRASGKLREGYAEIGDQRLHYMEAGEGPLIVLLHGFPEFWYGWGLQLEALNAAGFPGDAPLPLGLNPSIKPRRGYPASSHPTGAATTCPRSRTAWPPTPPTSWSPTSAGSSGNAEPSRRIWSAMTGAEPSPGTSR